MPKVVVVTSTSNNSNFAESSLHTNQTRSSWLQRLLGNVSTSANDVSHLDKSDEHGQESFSHARSVMHTDIALNVPAPEAQTSRGEIISSSRPIGKTLSKLPQISFHDADTGQSIPQIGTSYPVHESSELTDNFAPENLLDLDSDLYIWNKTLLSQSAPNAGQWESFSVDNSTDLSSALKADNLLVPDSIFNTRLRGSAPQIGRLFSMDESPKLTDSVEPENILDPDNDLYKWNSQSTPSSPMAGQRKSFLADNSTDLTSALKAENLVEPESINAPVVSMDNSSKSTESKDKNVSPPVLHQDVLKSLAGIHEAVDHKEEHDPISLGTSETIHFLTLGQGH